MVRKGNGGIRTKEDGGRVYFFFVNCHVADSKRLHAPAEGKITYWVLGRLQTNYGKRNHGQPTRLCRSVSQTGGHSFGMGIKSHEPKHRKYTHPAGPSGMKRQGSGEGWRQGRTLGLLEESLCMPKLEIWGTVRDSEGRQ